MSVTEGILTNGVTEILNKLLLVVAQEISLAWGVKDELKKLQATMEMILSVVADAERRQVTEEAVRLWLTWLKDVAYDADDVMDEFSYEAIRRSERGGRLKHKVLDFISSSHNPLAFLFKMAKKIKNINRRLDEITENMHKFQLQSASSPTIAYGESSEQQSRQHTTSFSSEPEIVGREDDKNQIINILTSPSSAANSEKIDVISLVGMGGLGKTTLAQLVYKDELVKKQFDLTMWIHVSECFDVRNILINTMESITQDKFDSMSNFDVLVSKVRQRLHGKKYLLVLDDVWNEDLEQWEILKSVLLVGAQGSKILITTRKDQVASIVRGTTPPYKLGKLTDAACWSMIEQKAFSPGGAPNTQEMTNIGKEIAKKCGGLPLAAKFLGSLLHSKNKESDWISIRNDDIWNAPEGQRKVLPVLKLSYNNLPSHLKQCFSYCSIFPKNREINKETLIHLWMAEGFLKPSDASNGRSIEDFGNEYFESLVWSSFFHNIRKNNLGDIKTCKMHDLVHDLAEDVLGKNELVFLKASDCTDVSEARRLQLDLDEDVSPAFLKILSRANKLRTIFIPEGSKVDPCIFSKNNHLRILHVHYSAIDDGPKWRSLRVLKHLRYLRLTSLDLSEVKSDQSINELYNLETLVLNEMGIGVRLLLANIQSLKKLRYLEVSYTGMEVLPDSVIVLSNLQTLDLNHCELKVIPESISGLKNLRFLNLSVNRIEELPVSLITLSNLQTLDVSSCKYLKALPESVAGLTNLRIFDFNNCPLLKALPGDFGALTLLRYLNLKGTEIRVLPESCTNLKNLEFVDLFWCELPKEVTNWTKLRRLYYKKKSGTPMGVGKLVFLQRLTYKVCENVIGEAKCSSDGIEELGDLNSLKWLWISNLQSVKDSRDAERANLKGKQKLRTLRLGWKGIGQESGWDEKSCDHALRVFEALQPPTGLRNLRITNYMGWELPSWMSGLTNLVELKLENCTGITKLPASIGQLPRLWSLDLTGMPLKSLDISGFPSLRNLLLTDMFLVEELCYSSCPSRLRDMRISSCKSLTKIPVFPCLTILALNNTNHKLVCSTQTSLVELYLENIEDLLYFPISVIGSNCNLKILEIRDCNQFQGFDDGNDSLLGPDPYSGVSVRQLRLFDCPVLKFLPDLRGWTCLHQLVIYKCPQLKESLTYDLKSHSSLEGLWVDFLQRDEQRGDPSAYEDMINLIN